MANYVVQDTQLTSVANAIRAKGGTSAQLEWPQGYIDAVDAITTGGGSASVAAAKDVNFRDYDGTVVYSYTADEFAALTAMPDNPDHSGDEIPLTAQGWNWSLTDAQAYVAKHGRLEIGQMYIATGGKTHILIHLEQGRTSPKLGCCPNGTVDVDWGDGTEHNTLTGTSITTVKWTPTHKYAAPGNYDIRLTVTGSMGFYGTSSSNQYSGLLRYTSGSDNRNYIYQNAIQRVNIGRGVISIGSYAFYYCNNLASISIPDSVTSIERNAFYNCYTLSSINIPNRVTNIYDYAFNNCYSLSSISIPDGLIGISGNAFQACYSLTSINIPDSVNNIGGNVFGRCSSLSSINISDGVTSIPSGIFSECYNLSSISIPASVTNIGNSAFYKCYSLASISIPDGVTSIGSYAFQACFSLSSISIPDGVTSVVDSTFNNCYGISEYHFASTTPPTLSNTNAFTGIAADCIIYVPYSEDHSILEAYKTATNWSTYASKMQEEPQA